MMKGRISGIILEEFYEGYPGKRIYFVQQIHIYEKTIFFYSDNGNNDQLVCHFLQQQRQHTEPNP